MKHIVYSSFSDLLSMISELAQDQPMYKKAGLRDDLKQNSFLTLRFLIKCFCFCRKSWACFSCWASLMSCCCAWLYHVTIMCICDSGVSFYLPQSTTLKCWCVFLFPGHPNCFVDRFIHHLMIVHIAIMQLYIHTTHYTHTHTHTHTHIHTHRGDTKLDAKYSTYVCSTCLLHTCTSLVSNYKASSHC